MYPIKNIVKTAEKITSWFEGDEEFSVTRNALGLPSEIKSVRGRWPAQKCSFTYDASGNFVSLVGSVNTLMLPSIIAEATGVPTVQDGVLMGPDGAISTGTGLEETSPESGIYIAEVANKVGTYAELMAYPGAVGQVSFASDVDVMFKHSGTAGTAHRYFKNNSLYTLVLAAIAPTTISATSTVFTPLVFDGSEQTIFGAPELWTTGANTEIVCPASTTAIYALEASAIWVFAADADGTIRRLRLEAWDGSAWAAAGSAVDILVNSTASGTEPTSGYATIIGVGGAGQNRFRISAASSAGTAIGVSVAGYCLVNIRRLA